MHWHRIRLQPLYKDITKDLTWFQQEHAPPGIHCIHCTLPVEGRLYPIPLRQRGNNVFEVLGGCGACSFSCLRGLMRYPRITGLSNIGLNLTLLKRMLSVVYEVPREVIRKIKAAPPVTVMVRYGGNMSDAEYKAFCHGETNLHSISVFRGELLHVTPMYVKEMKRKRVEENNEMIAKLASEERTLNLRPSGGGGSSGVKRRKTGLLRFAAQDDER